MKRSLLLCSLSLSICIHALSQPSFSWKKYISAGGDQLRQSPCISFAAIAEMQTMHNLFFNTTGINLSERQLYTCGQGGLAQTFQYIQQNGALPEECDRYPAIACDNSSDRGAYPKIYDGSIDCNTIAMTCSAGKLYKVNYENVTAQVKNGIESIKSLLISKGPIAIYLFATAGLHANTTNHAYMLYGWTNTGNWIVTDSWPCQSNIAAEFPMDSFVSSFVADAQAEAVVVTSVQPLTRTNGVWLPDNLPIKPFELEPENQIVTITASSSCLNQGDYTVTGLEKIPGATVSWSMRTADYNNSASITTVVTSPPYTKGVVRGHAAGATIIATIRRPNGMLENVSKYVGDIGLPVKITQSFNCMPGRGEVWVTASGNYNSTSNWSIPNGNYSTFYSGNQVIVIFSTPGTALAQYTVKSTLPGCTVTNSIPWNITPQCNMSTSTYRMDLTGSDISSDSLHVTAEGSIFPNPAKTLLTINPFGAKATQVTIRNISGDVVYDSTLSTSTLLDITAWKRGLYIVHLTSTTKRKNFKLILE